MRFFGFGGDGDGKKGKGRRQSVDDGLFPEISATKRRRSKRESDMVDPCGKNQSIIIRLFKFLIANFGPKQLLIRLFNS